MALFIVGVIYCDTGGNLLELPPWKSSTSTQLLRNNVHPGWNTLTLGENVYCLFDCPSAHLDFFRKERDFYPCLGRMFKTEIVENLYMCFEQL